MIANTNVRSATFDQKSVHNHSVGSHANTELTEINVSGKIDITETTISHTIYVDIWKLFANNTAYFDESNAHFMIQYTAAANINKFTIMPREKYKYETLFS